MSELWPQAEARDMELVPTRRAPSDAAAKLWLDELECQRRCDFVIFRRTRNVRKRRVKVCSL